ncbi:MAG: hypothetical protein GKC07_03905 [Methanomicrobiales archaeon]|nr:hypothetical protein [Methanomicrobiales archaeon]
MKREDEIMADYLLKGGKMLSACCPSCGCPLFEVKGETLCVVCREMQGSEEQRGEQLQPEPSGEAAPDREEPAGIGHPSLAATLEGTLVALSLRIREEPDPERVMVLMNSLKRGIEALRLLTYR